MLHSKKFTKSGLTIVELLVVTALLMIVLIPIMGMFTMSTRTSAAAYDLSSAAITAQLRMEELVGMTREELCAEFGETNPTKKTITWSNDDYNGFHISAEVTFDYTADGETYPELAEAVITVFNRDGSSVLCTQANILNVVAIDAG